MECNKEEAMRAKEIAEALMVNKDFTSAQKIALKAQQLFPDLDNICHMILVCNVHCSSRDKVLGDDTNWYSILNIDPSADESSIKKQYRKYALSLHPDKNNFPGSTDAFKLIVEAQMVFLDHDKRAIFDSKCKAARERSHDLGAKKPLSERKSQWGVSKVESTFFWTLCPSCCLKYKFRADLVNRSVWCQTCKTYFNGQEIKVEATPEQKKEKTSKRFPKKSLHRCCENSTSKGVYQENNCNGKGTRESIEKRENPEVNKKSKSFRKGANLDVKTDKEDVEYHPQKCTHYKGVYHENDSNGKTARESIEKRESSEINKKFKSFEKIVNLVKKTDKGGVEYLPHKLTQSKLHAYYSTLSTESNSWNK